MIPTVRKVLKGILANQSMDDENCLTLMAEIEANINSRPSVLNYFSNPGQEPLTPNHLLPLQGKPNLTLDFSQRMIIISKSNGTGSILGKSILTPMIEPVFS